MNNGNNHNKATYNKIDLKDRTAIELGLCRKESIKEISVITRHDRSSIAREIKAGRTFLRGDYYCDNDCRDAEYCKKSHLCGDLSCHMYCATCSNDCHNYCSEYISLKCPIPQKPPYVCNACHKRKYCQSDRYFYSAIKADQYSKKRRSQAHEGAKISDEDLQMVDKVIYDGIKKGQPLSHIMSVHSDEIPVCKRTIYNYIDEKLLRVRNIDLRKKARYKKRHKKHPNGIVKQSFRKGRTYLDFTAFMKGRSDSIVTEMDTVKGKKGSKACLFTLFLRRNSVMIIFIMEDGTQDSILKCLDFLEVGLGLEVYKRLFGVLLTDNGAEFKDAEGIELTQEGIKRSMVFYCDPMASGQKGRLEKNHEYIRYVIPKGKSFTGYSSADITLLMNHINSTIRESLNNRSPYDVIPDDDEDMHKLMKLLNMEEIMPEDICLTPQLISPAPRLIRKAGRHHD
ncbi:IS30 family transposase [Butyrivibrio fibrisolvens]|uniref:IS30 family transposase n=1 Tax=Butyrivibrio fibrisolvens TaxID=831 RepID=UPI0003B6F206|nr:IS30 family transposase [Butyrivibrio fibrisolvens]